MRKQGFVWSHVHCITDWASMPGLELSPFLVWYPTRADWWVPGGGKLSPPLENHRNVLHFIHEPRLYYFLLLALHGYRASKLQFGEKFPWGQRSPLSWQYLPLMTLGCPSHHLQVGPEPMSFLPFMMACWTKTPFCFIFSLSTHYLFKWLPCWVLPCNSSCTHLHNWFSKSYST